MSPSSIDVYPWVALETMATPQSFKTLQGVVVLSSLCRVPTIAHLKSLPLERSRYLALYKRFYRLRMFVGQNKWKLDHYCRILRRRFQREDFNERRSVVLSAADPSSETPIPTLDNDGILNRLVNTLAFVHNSTVHLPSAADEKRPLYFEDLKVPQRMEAKIIGTILEMDRSQDPRIKHDPHYKWITEITSTLASIDPEILPKQFPKMFPSSPGMLIGMRAHEITVMGLNETMQLCL